MAEAPLTRFAAIILSIGLVAACGEGDDGGSSSSSSESSDPLKLLIIAPTTGPVAAYGEAFQQGLEAGVEHINADGGVDGRTIEARVVDSGADPARATTLLQEAIDEDRPDMVWTGATSNEALALLPVLTREKIFSMGSPLSPAAADPEDFPYNFNTVVPAAIQVEAYSQYLQESGVQTTGLIAANDEQGETIVSVVNGALEAVDIDLVGIERYAPTDTDMTSQLRRLDGTDPDLILIQAAASPAGYILSGVEQVGMDRRLFGDISMSAFNLEATASAASLEQLELFSYAVQTRGEGGRAGTPYAEEAIELIKEQAGGSIEQGMNLYSFGFDAVHVWATAVENAGSTAAEDLQAELETWAETPPDQEWFSYESFSYSPGAHAVQGSAADFAVAQGGTLDEGTREVLVALGD